MSESRFDALLEYLDAENSSSAPPSEIELFPELDDNISAMSLSPNTTFSKSRRSDTLPPPAPQMRQVSASSIPKYVWEEEPSSAAGSIADDKSHVSLRSGSSTITASAVAQLKEKLSEMQKQFEEHQKTIKALQSELARVNSVLSRRKEREVEKWEEKLKEIRSQNASILKAKGDQLENLKSDLESLSSKKAALQSRLNELTSGQSEALTRAELEAQRKFARAKRQWEADEKVNLEKIASSKLEIMKKQAADSFGPQLEKMVMSGKEAVRKRVSDKELEYLNLNAELESQFEETIKQFKSNLGKQYQDEQDQARKAADRKLASLRNKFEDEMHLRRERWSRRRNELVELMDRNRMQDVEQFNKSLQDVRNKEDELVSELMTRHQKALDETSSNLAKRRSAEEAKQTDLERAFKTRQQDLRQKQQAEMREKQISEAKAKLAFETERILDRLRTENASEKNSKKRIMDEELANIRAESESRLKVLQEADRSQCLEINILQKDVEERKVVVQSSSGRCDTLASEIESSTRRLEDLKCQLKASEERCASILRELSIAKEHAQAARKKAVEKEVELCAEEIALQEKIEEAEEFARRNFTEKEDMYKEQLQRVQEKIEQLYFRREQRLMELRQTQEKAQHEVHELEEVLRGLRTRNIDQVAETVAAMELRTGESVGSSSKGKLSGSKVRTVKPGTQSNRQL